MGWAVSKHWLDRDQGASVLPVFAIYHCWKVRVFLRNLLEGAVTIAGRCQWQLGLSPSTTGSKEVGQHFRAWAASPPREVKEEEADRGTAHQHCFSCPMIPATSKSGLKGVYGKILGKGWVNTPEKPQESKLLLGCHWRCHLWMVLQITWVLHRLAILCGF